MSISNFKKKLAREADKGIRKILAPKYVRELPPEWPVDDYIAQNGIRIFCPVLMTIRFSR